MAACLSPCTAGSASSSSSASTGRRSRRSCARLAREFDLGGVILFTRNVESPEQVAAVAVEAQQLGPRPPALGGRGPGGRPRRAAEAAVHRVAGDGGARPGRRRVAREPVRRRARRRTAGRRHLDRLRPRARRPHQPEEPGDRRPRARRSRGRRRAARRGDRAGAPGRRAWPRAASTFRGTATPASIRTSTCPSSSTRPTACRPWTSCRSGRRSRPASRRS